MESLKSCPLYLHECPEKQSLPSYFTSTKRLFNNVVKQLQGRQRITLGPQAKCILERYLTEQNKYFGKIGLQSVTRHGLDPT